MVLVATTARRRSEAFRVEPALNANQQKKSRIVPRMAIGMLWPGKARAVPSFLNLPIRGPMTMAAARAIMPPIVWTTAEPAKSTTPWPSPKLRPREAIQPPPQTQLPNSG